MRLVLLVFVAPAACTVLSQVEDRIQLSAWLRWFVENWEMSSQAVWRGLFGWLRPWVSIDLEKNQLNGLSLSALFLGASVSSLVQQKLKMQPEPSRPPWWFWLFYFVAAALMMVPTLVSHRTTLGFELLSEFFVLSLFCGPLVWLGWLSPAGRRVPGGEALSLDMDSYSFFEMLALAARSVVEAVLMFAPAAAFALPESSFGAPTVVGAEVMVLLIFYLVATFALIWTSWQAVPRLVALVVGVLIADRLIQMLSPLFDRIPQLS